MKNWKKGMVSALVGVALGVSLHFIEQGSGYSSGNVEGFMLIVLVLSILAPIVGALQVAYEVKKEVFKPVAKNFFLSILFVSLSLLLGAIIYTFMYCTFGACSEFAGMEILFTAIWIPVMTLMSALLTLIGVWILLRVRR